MADIDEEFGMMTGTIMDVFEVKLREATALARSANALQANGLADRAFETLMDVEPLIHDASLLLNGATVIRRHRRREPPFA